MDRVQRVLWAVQWAPRGEPILQTAENGQTLAVSTMAAGQHTTNWPSCPDSSDGVKRDNEVVEGFLHEQIMFADTSDTNKRGPCIHTMNPLQQQKGRGYSRSEKASVILAV